MIKCYVINLSRRKDRLEKIRKHLSSLKLDFVRFEAIDYLKVSKERLMKNMDLRGPLGNISDGDRACFQSHYKLWKHIHTKHNSPVLILEDDVILSKNATKLFNCLNWIPNKTKIIKIDRFGNQNHKILISKNYYNIELHKNYKLHYLFSKHNGTGGYIVTPKGVEFLLSNSDKVNISVDHYLFNPNNSPIFKKLQPFQLVPSICQQNDAHSDIHKTRLELRKKNIQFYLRELIRGYYELKLLPKQIFLILSKNAELIKPVFF